MTRLAAPVIVVDMGGTTTRTGIFDNGFVLRDVSRFTTPRCPDVARAREMHLDLVAAEVSRCRAAQPGQGPRKVGVAVGATVQAPGIIRNAAMLWGEAFTGFDLLAALRARLPWADVVICNDIAAAAWRYRECGRFALLTVSTGVAVRIFDDALPFASKLIDDDDGLSGEIGHVLLYRPGSAPGARDGEPICECGNAGDLCSYTSGPATARLAAARAEQYPGLWQASVLCQACAGEPARITTRALAAAASVSDEFVTGVLEVSTRPLAALILQLSALLGLRRFVVMGGFANGVGEPWFTALRANLCDLLPQGGWFTGWTSADVAALVSPGVGDDNDSLLGMGAYLAERLDQVRELRKPVGAADTVICQRQRPKCGREQFLARIAFAGVCGTDLQIMRGERDCEPGVLGHECVAQVVKVGAAAVGCGVEPGDVITVNPNHPTDEHEKLGHNLPGILRDVAVWDRSMVDRGQVIALPSDSSAAWVLLEPLSCTVRSLQVGRQDWAGRQVLVVGAGIAGLLHALLAHHWGADRVLVVSRGARRLGTAVSRGLIQASDCLAIAGDGGDWCASLEASAGARSLDSVIVAVSDGRGAAIVESLWPYLADGASVHLFGGFPPFAEIRTPRGKAPAHVIRSTGKPWEVSLPGGRTCALVGSRGSSGDDFQAAKDVLLSGDLDSAMTALVTHVISLDAAPAVLSELAATGCVRGEPALRVVVDLRLTGHTVHPVNGTPLPQIGVEP